MNTKTLKAKQAGEGVAARLELELAQDLRDARALAKATQAEVVKARDALRLLVLEGGEGGGGAEHGGLGNVIGSSWANWWRKCDGSTAAVVPPLPVMDLRAQSTEARGEGSCVYLLSAEFLCGESGECWEAGKAALPCSLIPCAHV